MAKQWAIKWYMLFLKVLWKNQRIKDCETWNVYWGRDFESAQKSRSFRTKPTQRGTISSGGPQLTLHAPTEGGTGWISGHRPKGPTCHSMPPAPHETQRKDYNGDLLALAVEKEQTLKLREQKKLLVHQNCLRPNGTSMAHVFKTLFAQLPSTVRRETRTAPSSRTQWALT